MFAVGTYIIYGVEGVCKVEAIGPIKMSGSDKNRLYYTLVPYYRGGVVYTPVDGKVFMRDVLTKQDLEALLPTLPQLEPLSDVPADIKLAGSYYRELLASHDCTKLLRLCKTLYQKQQQLAANRKTVSATEMRSWKAAEEMLYGEFGFVLGVSPETVKENIFGVLQNNSAS